MALRSEESVWDYPRPPKLENQKGHVRIVHSGIIVADSNKALRILETSHPPTVYIPFADLNLDILSENNNQSFCEFKGRANYFDLALNGQNYPNVAWFYKNPSKGYEGLKDHAAFYASRLDECYIDEERVKSQEGDFYGGWITSNIKGPFKGGAGTFGW